MNHGKIRAVPVFLKPPETAMIILKQKKPTRVGFL
jgi:hypothetical protein